MNNKRLNFSKESRLTTSREFMYAFKNSYKITTKDITTFITINNLEYPRIGIIISKKYVKHAHERNHIKRLIRESFRIHQHRLSKMDFIVTIQKKIIDFNKNIIKETLNNIWRYNHDATFKNINKINTYVSNTYQSVVVK